MKHKLRRKYQQTNQWTRCNEKIPRSKTTTISLTPLRNKAEIPKVLNYNRDREVRTKEGVGK